MFGKIENRMFPGFLGTGKSLHNLINIVNTAGKVEEGEECLIFAEEFI
jgi:hypothetical protein